MCTWSQSLEVEIVIVKLKMYKCQVVTKSQQKLLKQEERHGLRSIKSLILVEGVYYCTNLQER
jgi:hypothetical protein